LTKDDLNFTLDGLYTFKYPQDFKAIKFKQNGKQSMALLLPTILDIQDPFSVQAKIAFDVHMADFAIDLVSYETEDEGQNVETEGLPTYEVVARSSPLENLVDNDDETFIREITQTHISPSAEDRKKGVKYMLAIEEKQAHYIFNEVAKSEGVDDLCLPFIFKIKVIQGTKKRGMRNFIDQAKASADISKSPAVIDFKIIQSESHARANQLVVPYNVHRISAVVLLTE
jgi:hypothetical protein